MSLQKPKAVYAASEQQLFVVYLSESFQS